MTHVSPASALSRLGMRIRERRQRSDAGEPSLTGEDEANIAAFEQLVQSTLTLLRAENDALGAGDVDRIAQLFGEKEELMKALEQRQPVIEPFLQDGGDNVSRLRELLGELAAQLTENGRLLRGMAEASSSILGEIEQLRKRESLDGIYDRAGKLRDNSATGSGGFVKNI
ncbi:hypothetical protein ACFSUD_08215 [Sulfitobacter aestuarii]|uniref:Flagellar protein FlgN n=1 Tax=Sulfitobacter aestuarii TaxID=2161676 RepID=A0ABW5U0Z1_9RHOB